MELREYQKDILNKIRLSYKNGKKSPVIVLPCGGGKSVIAAEITKLSTSKGNRVLFLLHRIELQEQIQETFIWWGVDMSMCDIEMVQSATKKYTKEVDYIITDERTSFYF